MANVGGHLDKGQKLLLKQQLHTLNQVSISDLTVLFAIYMLLNLSLLTRSKGN